MYILKNSLTSIVRNKGRNILISIIIIVIACAVSVTLAIDNSSTKLIESYESKYDVEATISMNRSNLMQGFNKDDRENSKTEMNTMFESANQITEEDINKFGDSDFVKQYYYIMQTGVNSDTLEKAEMASPSSSTNSTGSTQAGGANQPMSNQPMMEDNRGGGMGGFKNQTSGDFTVKGYSSIDSMTEFVEGSYTMTSGQVFEDFNSNYCLINSELATLNDISVGDTITVCDADDSSLTYDLVVSGIFEEKMNNDNGMSMFSDSVNTIITSTSFVNALKTANSELQVSTTPTFILTSADVVEDFESELKEKGLSEYLTIQTNLDQVEGATSTISNVKTFAITFLVITLVIGTVVLLVINMINIRERKYEIGVLRTIGMKKSFVCLQFILELLIIAIVSLIIGAGIGASVSVPISNSLLANEIESSQAETSAVNQNFGKGGMQQAPNDFQGIANVQAFDDINAVVDFKVLLELLGIGLLITLISSISAVTSIQKFSPLTILKERS